MTNIQQEKHKITTPIAIIDNLTQLKKQTLFYHVNYSCLSFAHQDFDYVKQCLLSYVGSEATYNTYRREIERYLQWLWLIQKKSVLDIRRTEIEAYLVFCYEPPKDWIGKEQAPRFISKKGLRIPNKQWQPFVLARGKRKYVLSQAGWKSLFAVLSSFYQFLIEERYAEINPVTQIRQKSRFIRKGHSQQQIRRLSELQWDYVIETAAMMADHNKLHERTLFIVSCLYGMYLRISELTASNQWIPRMHHFYQDNDGNWWFKTVGKGNKERIISVSNAMLKALKRYRKSMQLSVLPSYSDATPLIIKNHGQGAISSTRHIRRIVQTCFDYAIERMNKDQFIDEAEQLKAATVHWLRHTGISEDVKIRPREHVRDDAGHSSGAITDHYIDVELRQRHASAKKKQIKSNISGI